MEQNNLTECNEHNRLWSTMNLDDVQREAAEIERRLTPFVNILRAIQGKPPLVPATVPQKQGGSAA